jgi:hypothetical protein
MPSCLRDPFLGVLTIWFMAIAAGGCSERSVPLARAEVPLHADLSGVRAVDVRLSAPRAVLGGAAASVELVRPDGKVVLTGRLDADRPMAVRVVLPTKDSGLTATLRAADGSRRSLALSVQAGVATGRFQ